MTTRNRIVRPGGWTAVLVSVAICCSESAWAQSHSKTYFVGQDGVPVLTNRPSAYRTKPGYVEKKIVFNPVVSTGRYHFSPGQFSAKDFRAMVNHWSKRYGLDPNLVLGLIRAESAFDPNAVSKEGARGLMQLMPGTAADMSVSNCFDPEQNIAGGTQYLAKLLEAFDNRLDLALAAYNAGPSSVQDHKGVPPFKETRDYVKKVQQYAREFARGDDGIVLAANLQPAADYLPVDGAKYTIHFKNGLTQRAETVQEQELFYAVSYSGHKMLVRKTNVERIAKAQ